ncbi:MAG: ABC transporter permease [Synergistaceae bacterium]|jgi:putative ABC transport system permease protein|nr:ABC transporter permease [Synergistaceae bacterium]
MREHTFTSLDIALENLRRKPFRTFCMTAFVALLAFVLSGGSLLAFSLLNGISSMSQRLGAEALLVPKGYERKVEGALLRGEPSAFYLDGDLAQKLMRVEGIAQASPQLFIATMDSSHCAFPVQLIGYVPESDFVIAPWLKKQLPSGLRDGEVVIGNSIEAKPGVKLRFFATDYLVKAQLERTGMGFDTTVFFNMKTARDTLKEYAKYSGARIPDLESAVSVITVDLAGGADPTEFARNIRGRFRQEGAEVILTKSLISNVAKGLNALLTLIAVLALILWALAVGVLAILFAVTLNERKREFGIFRALGSTRKKLVYIVLSESAVVSLGGAVTGIALLCALAFSFAPLIGLTVEMPYLQPSVATTAFLLGLCLAVSFLTGALASAYSAANIGKLATSAILKEGE